jgi:tetratricopeptide (TPR) repeat protein
MKLVISHWTLVIVLAVLTGCSSISRKPVPQNESFLLAEEKFLQGDFQDAISHYQKFIVIEPVSPYVQSAYYRIGVSYLALADYQKAEENLLKVLKNPSRLNPHLYEVLTYQALGEVYQAQHKYKQAIYYYQKALKSNKNQLSITPLYYNLSVYLMRNNQYPDGRRYMQLALESLDRSAQDNKLREHIVERLSMPPDIFTVQLGKYLIKDNAVNYQKELQEEKGVSAIVNIIIIDGREYYYVWTGRYPTFEQAQKEANKLNEKGIEAVVIP